VDAQQPVQTSVDELLLLIGRLTAENHALRRALAEAQSALTQAQAAAQKPKDAGG
jgi:hypothetical protein